MGSSLSDYNDTKSARVSRNYQYSDIDPTFTIHPIYNDILSVNDLDAIKSSLKNLVLTGNHERVFQPNLGSGISSLLFENADTFTAFSLKDKIETVIRRFEPRVSDVTVTVLDNSEKNAYQITIKFLASFDRVADVTFYINRIR